jgi:hypothetical protein
VSRTNPDEALRELIALAARSTAVSSMLRNAQFEAEEHEEEHRRRERREHPSRRPRYAMNTIEVGAAWVMARVAEQGSTGHIPESWAAVAGLPSWRIRAAAVAEMLLADPDTREAFRAWCANHGQRCRDFDYMRDARR